MGLRRRLRELNPDAFLIGEVWEDASNKIAYDVRRRYFTRNQLDSVMNYPWQKGIVAFVRGEDDGSALGEGIMRLAENYPPEVLACVMNLLGTHDTMRILTVLGGEYHANKAEWATARLSPEARALAVRRLHTAAFLQFMLPGMASIYYGDEAGLEGGADPFCRRYYPWGAEDESLRSFYAALCRVKNETQALKTGNVRVTEAGNGRLSFVRKTESQAVEVYVNQSGTDWELPQGGTLRFGGELAWTDGRKVSVRPGGFALLIR